jgi:hypothetical protein
MKPALLSILLLAVTSSPAAAQWERIGAAGPVVSDEERWLVLQEDGQPRAYDTRTRRFAPPFAAPEGCPLNALGRGRAVLRCSAGQSHLTTGFHLVDLAAGTVRKLHRRGNRKALSVDTFMDVGRRWAGGLSCGSSGQRVCPQVYVDLRTGKRIRVADRKHRDLDSRKLRVIRRPVPPAELVQTGPPQFDLLLRRPGRADELLRNCRDSMECWNAYERADVAFWRSDDATLNAFDARTDVRRTLEAPDGTSLPVATATRHALVLTTGAGVYVTPR